MSLKIITVGDKTDHGGTVISGSPNHRIRGREIALYPYGTKPGGFFADESTLAASKKSVSAYHEATQVGHSGNSRLWEFGPRQKVRAFTLKEDLCVGKSYALANDQYGPGGGTQYYISVHDRATLKKGSIMELTNP